MKQQKRIDKILEAVEARIQDEVGGLIGADFSVVGGERKLVSKEVAFDTLQGKQICAHMDITGEIAGEGCLLIGIKDAIRLGGTLIMLPGGELEEVIGREEYSEEIEDSYGEIANIIAGSFTKDFEEMYPKSCRFVRKGQEIVAPAKVDIEADSPVVNQTYYQVLFSMVLDGRQMGNLVMLMPAATFGLQAQENVDGPTESTDQPKVVVDEKVQEEKPEAHQEKPEAVASEAPVIEESQKAGPKFDVVKHKKKVDLLLAECQKKMEAEVSALLGVEINLSGIENQFLSKEDFFADHVAGRQVLTDMEVSGEIQGKSYLAVSVKDAIHLGGILIMLPPSELENVVKEEDFSEDARDAYGEIANIISGVYTSVFEEQYSQKLRFIRKEFREIVPAKVDVASDEPIPDQSYYTSSISITAEGQPLGKLHMLFPAEMLRLNTPKEEVKPDFSPAVTEVPAENKKSVAAPTEENVKDGGSTVQSQLDIKSIQKRVDKLLATCREKMAAEVSALLGASIKLSAPDNFIVSKEEFFFDEVSGKQVIANMDIVGELEGKSYLSIGLRDAVRIGGVLIMLPTSELESVVAEEEFSEDIQDAYGEIANIISGVYTAVFEEQYSKKIRFVKTDLQQVAPMKVDISADEPILDQDYYLSRMDISLGDLEMGKVNFLIPADLLQLSGLRQGSDASEEGEELPASGSVQAEEVKTGQENAQRNESVDPKSIDILVVGDDDAEALKIANVLRNSGHTVKTLSFKDNLHNYIPGNLKAIYLVMKDVNEQAFGVAIKVSSACSVPLIAAGPGWTRTKVIKAVKYGVRDILLTPASEKDIEENAHNNLLELAA